ncbi:MAG: hypothetical protein RLZZ153_2421, partial [Pseudomonadota bacterium]
SLAGAQTCDIIRHSFTHYRLVAQPQIFTSEHDAVPLAREQRAALPQGTEFRWVDLQEVSRQALPAPIRAFLGGLVGPFK